MSFMLWVVFCSIIYTFWFINIILANNLIYVVAMGFIGLTTAYILKDIFKDCDK